VRERRQVEEDEVEEELSLPKAGHPSRLLRAKKANKTKLEERKKRATDQDEDEALLEREDEDGDGDGTSLNLADVGTALEIQDLKVHQRMIVSDPPPSPPSPAPADPPARTFSFQVSVQKEGASSASPPASPPGSPPAVAPPAEGLEEISDGPVLRAPMLRRSSSSTSDA
jgi:hypothetical protein